MGELLGALGLAWPRLLLYPGGLFALVMAQLLAAWLNRCANVFPVSGPRSSPLHPQLPSTVHRPPFIGLIAAVPPLAVLSLLPLAPARSFPYGLDLVVALSLLEWPRLLAELVAPQLADRSLPQPRVLTRPRLLRDYLPLLVAAVIMAEAVGGFELTRLLRLPEGWPERGLLAAGATLWLVALPRILASGPEGLAGRLRGLGLLSVAALPLLGALAVATAGLLPGELAGWLLPPAALLIAGATLGGLVRLRERRNSARDWPAER